MTGNMVVVIVDEPALLGLLADILEGEGYQVAALDHPGLISGAIAGREPSLFLFDLILPHISGITLAERLHVREHGAVPLVGMSAIRVLIQEATASGLFADTLEKPFDVESLLACVALHVPAGSDRRGTYHASAQR